MLSSPEPLGTYVHGARIGALVAVRGGERALAHDLAMHVAASEPAYIERGAGAGRGARKEREILTEQTKGEKKPPRSSPRWSRAGCASTSAKSPWPASRSSRTRTRRVEKLLKRSGAEVVAFVRYEVGAGIEKKQDDFVGEVMAQVKGADPAVRH